MVILMWRVVGYQSTYKMCHNREEEEEETSAEEEHDTHFLIWKYRGRRP